MCRISPYSILLPRFSPFRCPQESGCAGAGPPEPYCVRWVDTDHAHHLLGARTEREAQEAAREYAREGALCACVSLRLYRVTS